MSNARIVVKHLKKASQLAQKDCKSELYQKSKDAYRSDVVLAVSGILSYVSTITGVNLRVVGEIPSSDGGNSESASASSDSASKDNSSDAVKRFEERMDRFEERMDRIDELLERSLLSRPEPLPSYSRGCAAKERKDDASRNGKESLHAASKRVSAAKSNGSTQAKRINVRQHVYPNRFAGEFNECMQAFKSRDSEEASLGITSMFTGACADWFKSRYVDNSLPDKDRAFNLCNAPGWLVNFCLSYSQCQTMDDKVNYLESLSEWSRGLSKHNVAFGGPKFAQNKHIKNSNLSKDQILSAYDMWCGMCDVFNCASESLLCTVKLYKDQFIYRLQSLQLMSDVEISNTFKEAFA